MLVRVAAQHGGQQRHAQQVGRRKAQPALGAALHILQIVARLFLQPQQFAGRVEIALALRGQHHAALAAQEQLHAHLPLQRLYGARDGAGRGAQCARGQHEALAFGDGAEHLVFP
ncbi:hypothetical protein D3C87_1672800 [compost metagenome]